MVWWMGQDKRYQNSGMVDVACVSDKFNKNTIGRVIVRKVSAIRYSMERQTIRRN